jgi:hypothetical protein
MIPNSNLVVVGKKTKEGNVVICSNVQKSEKIINVIKIEINLYFIIYSVFIAIISNLNYPHKNSILLIESRIKIVVMNSKHVFQYLKIDF